MNNGIANGIFTGSDLGVYDGVEANYYIGASDALFNQDANNPKIIQNGLILHFDAANHLSYPRTGRVFRDLKTNKTATITGTFNFDDRNHGYLTGFVGNDSRFTVVNPDTTPIASCTIQCFFAYEGSQNEGATFLNYSDGTNNVALNNGFAGGRNVAFQSNSGGFRGSTWGTELADGAWSFASGVRDATNLQTSISVNGGTRVINSHASLDPFRPTTAWMLSRFETTGIVFRGRYAVLLFYNRALSVAEELQNYNAIKYRYRL
jgi:hypothetical protein